MAGFLSDSVEVSNKSFLQLKIKLVNLKAQLTTKYEVCFICLITWRNVRDLLSRVCSDREIENCEVGRYISVIREAGEYDCGVDISA